MTIDTITTRADLEQTITELSKYAAHLQHHPDCTVWVRAHQRIDRLLCEWQAMG